MQNSIWLHHLNTRKKARSKIKKRARKIAKKMAKKIISDELKKSGFDQTQIEQVKRSSKFERIMHKLIFGIALIWPILTIPQILTIWVEKNASWLSLFTWGAYVISNTCWLIYGIVQKEKAIIFGNILWVIVNTAVTIGVIIYW